MLYLVIVVILAFVLINFRKLKKIFSNVKQAEVNGAIDNHQARTRIIIFISGLASMLAKLLQIMDIVPFYSVLFGFIPSVVFGVSLWIRYKKNAFDKIKKGQLCLDGILCIIFIVFAFVIENL